LDSLWRRSLKIEYTIREIEKDDLVFDKFKDYERYQLTTQKVKYEDGLMKTEKIHFINEWDANKLKSLVDELRDDLYMDSYLVGAFYEDKVIAFASIRNKFFGSEKQYLQMPNIHVSRQYRGKGIGKKLFAMCVKAANKMGAKRIYISTHPAIETQRFYESVGCQLASEINQELKKLEPHDIQLEYKIK